MPEDFVKSLSDLINRKFNVRTSYFINPENDEVDIAVTRILASNPKRIGFIILNLSVNNIFIAPDMQVSAARGIFLTPSGGSFSMSWDKDFEAVTLPWYGAAGANNSDVFAMEVFIV